MSMVIIVNSAQSNRIETMLNDDFKSNGIKYLLKLKNYVNDMIVDGINESIKNKYYDEIMLLSSVRLTDLFKDIDEVSFCELQQLCNYIKSTLNTKIVTVGHLLSIDYSELIRNESINLDTIEIIVNKLDELKIKKENGKQKTKIHA